MSCFVARALRLIRSEDGPTGVEYAVMLSLIAGVVIGAVELVGGKTSSAFGQANNPLSASAGGSGTTGSGSGSSGTSPASSGSNSGNSGSGSGESSHHHNNGGGESGGGHEHRVSP